MKSSIERKEELSLTTVFILWAMNSFALMLSARIFSGVAIEKWYAALLAGLVLTAAMYIVDPLLHLLTLPINVATFGFFIIIMNGAVLIAVSRMTPWFEIEGRFFGLFQAVLTSLVVSFFRILTRSALAGRRKRGGNSGNP